MFEKACRVLQQSIIKNKWERVEEKEAKEEKSKEGEEGQSREDRGSKEKGLV